MSEPKGNKSLQRTHLHKVHLANKMLFFFLEKKKDRAET